MIRIYPTTTFTSRDQETYQVVSFIEYLTDLSMEPYFIENIKIITETNEHILPMKTMQQAYLGYPNHVKDLTLIFRKDSTKQSWINGIVDIQCIKKEGIPHWGDEEDV